LANARRILARRAAVRYARLVPGIGLFGACHREADRAAVGVRARLSIDRLRHHEPPAVMLVDQPALGVLHAGLATNRAEQGVIKCLRAGDVVAPDHYGGEHFVSSPDIP
jgi:ABC-type uncharacterized transport system YnjBCD ATPase subunit